MVLPKKYSISYWADLKPWWIQPYLSHLFVGYFLFLWEGLEVPPWRLRIDFLLLSPPTHCYRPLCQLFKRRFPIKHRQERWESRHFRWWERAVQYLSQRDYFGKTPWKNMEKSARNPLPFTGNSLWVAKYSTRSRCLRVNIRKRH